jgi:hypothetical protein
MQMPTISPVARFEIVSRGQSVEKICDRFAFLTLENYVDQPPVVFGVSERDVGVRLPWIEVTKAKFQTDEEKALPILKFSRFAYIAEHHSYAISVRREGRASSLAKSRNACGMNVVEPGVTIGCQKDRFGQLIQDLLQAIASEGRRE